MTMRWAIQFSTLSLAVALGGCMGGYQSPSGGTPGTPGTHTDGTPDTTVNTPGTTANAQSLFIHNVQPFISTECASCHAVDKQAAGPKFLGSTGTYYGNLITDPRFANNKPDQSYLITHKHMVDGTGAGTDLTMAQAMNVINWLAQELNERTLPPPPVNIEIATDALNKFAGCMTLADFQSSQANQIWNTQVNGNGGRCNSCHDNGEHDIRLNADDTTSFNALHDMHSLLRFVVADVQPDGTCKDIIQANRLWQRGQEPGHPQYNGTNIQTWVDSFYQLTYTKWKAGTCTPPPAGP
jgi:hypothetical protein